MHFDMFGAGLEDRIFGKLDAAEIVTMDHDPFCDHFL
jgi:hypothetical protein